MHSNELNQVPVYIPDGVADPEGRSGVVSACGTKLVALNLLNGDILWEQNSQSVPILVWGNNLVALQPLDDMLQDFTIEIRDLQNGEISATFGQLSFPTKITGRSGPHYQLSVSYNDNNLRIAWENHQRYGGGVPPPQQIKEQYNQRYSGVFDVNLSGKEVLLKPFQHAQRGPQEKGSMGYELINHWHINNEAVNLLAEVKDDKLAYYLQSDAAATKSSSNLIKLVEGEALVPELSPDGQYLFFHSETEIQDQTWQVFETGSGNMVIEIPYEKNAQQPAIINNKLYYMVQVPAPGQVQFFIHCRDIDSKKILWKRSLCNKSYHARKALRK
jgi:hypothetical protein